MAYDLDGNDAAPASSPFIPVLQIVVDLAELLLRRWWMAVLGIAIGAGVGWWLVSKQPDVYVATAKIIVDENAPSAAPPPGTDPVDIAAEKRGALQRRVETLRSIPVADTVQRILTGTLD